MITYDAMSEDEKKVMLEKKKSAVKQSRVKLAEGEASSSKEAKVETTASPVPKAVPAPKEVRSLVCG